MANTELQFEMAMRDQIIHNQREAQRNLWNLLMGLGLDEKQILELAVKQGLTIEDSSMPPYLGQLDWKQSPNLDCRKSTPHLSCPCTGQTYSRSSCSFQNHQDFESRSSTKGHWDLAHTFCREEHHSSVYLLSHNHSPSAYLRLRRSSEHWISGRPSSWYDTHNNHHEELRKSFPEMKIQSSPCNEGCMSTSSLTADLGQQVTIMLASIPISHTCFLANHSGLSCFSSVLITMFIPF